MNDQTDDHADDEGPLVGVERLVAYPPNVRVRRAVDHVLRESFRVLTSGGRFSVGVPDAANALQFYVRDDRATYASFAASNPNYPPWLRIPMHGLNYTFRQFGEHKYAWDAEILTIALESAGFIRVRRRPFDPELDSEHRRNGTLYMEGIKP